MSHVIFLGQVRSGQPEATLLWHITPFVGLLSKTIIYNNKNNFITVLLVKTICSLHKMQYMSFLTQKNTQINVFIF